MSFDEFAQGSPESDSSLADILNDVNLSKRAALDLVDQSFEQVADTTAKLSIGQKMSEAVQQQYDNEREHMLNQYSRLRDTNERIVNRLDELIEQHTSLSPERKLEKALLVKSKREYLKDRIHELEMNAREKTIHIKNAESYLRTTKDPMLKSQRSAKINYNKQLVQQMWDEISRIKQDLAKSTDSDIIRLQRERSAKMTMLEEEINKTISNDPQLKELVNLRDKLQYIINTDNRHEGFHGYNTDPQDARSALENVQFNVEKHVQKLSEEGEQ